MNFIKVLFLKEVDLFSVLKTFAMGSSLAAYAPEAFVRCG